MRLTYIVAAIVFILLNLRPLHSQTRETDGLPSSWDVKQIEKAASNAGRFYVLAWHASAWKFEGREHRIDKCLALCAFGDGKADRWKLYHLYRDPGKKDSGWQISMFHAIGGAGGPTGKWYLCEKEFRSRPTNREIYDSLSSSVDWSFERGVDCVGCGVCEKTWREAIGEKPTEFFPPAKLTPRRPIAPIQLGDAPLTVSVSTMGAFAKGYSWHLSVNSAGQAELTVDGPERIRKQFQVPKEQWAEFRKAVDDGQFFDLQTEYGEEVPCGSEQSITVTAGRYTRAVKVHYLQTSSPEDKAKLREASRVVRLMILTRGWFDEANAVDLRRFDQAVLDAVKE